MTDITILLLFFAFNFLQPSSCVQTEETKLSVSNGARYCLNTDCFIHSTQWKDEDIYMVPTGDEDELYSQLQDIMKQDIKRHFVKYVTY